MYPDTFFMDPLAEPVPPVSPASPESATPEVVFTAPVTPEGVEDEPWTDPEIPFRPQPFGKQPSSQQRAGQRANRSGHNGRRGQNRGRWRN